MSIYIEVKVEQLAKGTQITYSDLQEKEENQITLTHDYWTLSMNLDLEAKEIVFRTDIDLNKWLAIGFANNLLDADVIQWIAGPEGINNTC